MIIKLIGKSKVVEKQPPLEFSPNLGERDFEDNQLYCIDLVIQKTMV